MGFSISFLDDSAETLEAERPTLSQYRSATSIGRSDILGAKATKAHAATHEVCWFRQLLEDAEEVAAAEDVTPGHSYDPELAAACAALRRQLQSFAGHMRWAEELVGVDRGQRVSTEKQARSCDVG